MAKRRAAVLLLFAAALAGCGAATVTDGSSPGRAAPQSSRAAPPTIAAVTPRTTAHAPKLKPKPNACARNAAAQLVLVSVTKQHLWMCARSHLVYSAAVTTGAVDLPDDSTPTGTYRIQGKTRDTTLTLLSGATYAVRYWIPFDGPLFGFHDSSWQHFPYGSTRYRTEGSHGCVHAPLAAMKVLYDWAAVGATVTIKA
jgi:L,D-transpeptidase catalytic domain